MKVRPRCDFGVNSGDANNSKIDQEENPYTSIRTIESECGCLYRDSPKFYFVRNDGQLATLIKSHGFVYQ